MKSKRIQTLAQKGKKLMFPLVSIVLALAISALVIRLIGCWRCAVCWRAALAA